MFILLVSADQGFRGTHLLQAIHKKQNQNQRGLNIIVSKVTLRLLVLTHLSRHCHCPRSDLVGKDINRARHSESSVFGEQESWR